jgi:hypothetical protein
LAKMTTFVAPFRHLRNTILWTGLSVFDLYQEMKCSIQENGRYIQ